MGVTCLAQVDLPEGKSGQQVVDLIQRKVELAGGERAGNWCIDCETYQTTSSIESSSRIIHLLHTSDLPHMSFAALENKTCVVAENGLDSLIAKLKSFYIPRKSGKTEAKGIKYEFGDFIIKIGNVSQGNNFKGVVVEFEYCPCSDVSQCWGLLTELVYSFLDDKAQILPPPKVLVDTKTGEVNVADTMLQYLDVFSGAKKASGT